MKYITGAPRNEETEVDSEATFTALGWFSRLSSDWLIFWPIKIVENQLKLQILKSLLTGSKVIFVKSNLSPIIRDFNANVQRVKNYQPIGNTNLSRMAMSDNLQSKTVKNPTLHSIRSNQRKNTIL